jgi:hypothetical protein
MEEQRVVAQRKGGIFLRQVSRGQDYAELSDWDMYRCVGYLQSGAAFVPQSPSGWKYAFSLFSDGLYGAVVSCRERVDWEHGLW